MAQYRFSNAQEWLESMLNKLDNEGNHREILEIARTIIGLLDADQIQNIFEQEMDNDGFFERIDLIACPECGDGFEESRMIDPEQHLSLDRQSVCINCHQFWLKMDNLICKGCSDVKEI